ncbi:unnamed protein product [Lactuca virosa]|uniref:Uncharacterized protein n=1 Tax=Lactuca virosa TaxID=75947 RepID=A0AAU9N166_9ASTR|nr:unnamed protein product [Lactuca virosa]
MDGGFGCGDVNEPCLEEECQESEYNEEESGGDEDESDGDDGLCNEDEEEFDVNKVSVVVKMEDLKKDLVVKIDQGVLKFPQKPILTPAFGQINDDEERTEVNDDEDYGNDFLNDHENVEDDDQGKCGGAEGDGKRAHEDHIGKNDVEGKVDGVEGDDNDHAYEDHMGTENLVDGCINQKPVEDDVNNNLTGTVNLGGDDHNKEVISDHTVDKVIVEKKKEDELIDPSLLKGFAEVLVEISKEKKDGEGVVKGEVVEVDSDLGKAIEDCSNKNKDGETTKEGLQIIQWKDLNETQSLKKDKAEGS